MKNYWKKWKRLGKLFTWGLEARSEGEGKSQTAATKIKNKKSKLKNKEDLLKLIKDELNVKEVIFDEKNFDNEVDLDMEITPRLKRRRGVKGINKTALQDLRKKAGLNPGQKLFCVSKQKTKPESLWKNFR